MAAEARAAASRSARAEQRALHTAQLEYQARIAPYVAEQQARRAQLEAQVLSEQAWLDEGGYPALVRRMAAA